jgi:hypothetical protein
MLNCFDIRAFVGLVRAVLLGPKYLLRGKSCSCAGLHKLFHPRAKASQLLSAAAKPSLETQGYGSGEARCPA